MIKNSKKALSVLLSLIMIMSMFTGLELTSFAKNDILNYLTYEINDGEVTITDCDSSISGDVIIPDTIEGYPVTTIGEFAFSGCGLSCVTIPDSITSIGESAFYECAIETIGLPDSINKISNGMFMYCENLEQIVIPEGITTIGSDAFAWCSNLKDVKIPESVTSINDSAFYFCYNLESILLPSSLTQIKPWVFYGCDSLTHVDIPNGVTSIGEMAFSCENLSSISIPPSVTYIDDRAFSHSDNLSVIYGTTGSTAETFANKYGIVFYTEEYPYEPPTTESPTDDEPVYLISNAAEIQNISIGDEFIFTISAKNMSDFRTADFEIEYDSEYLEFNSGEKSDAAQYDAGFGGRIREGLLTWSILYETPANGDASFFDISFTAKKSGETTITISAVSWDGSSEPTDVTEIILINENAGSSEDPTTQEPTTEEPTTVEPTTEEPTTEEPTTEEPTTKEPVTDAPTTEPTTQAPETTTQKPVSDKLEVSGDTVRVDNSSKVSTVKVKSTADDILKSVKNEKVEIVDKDGKTVSGDALVGTGAKIQVINKDGNIVNEYTVIVPTDIDGNGKTTAADARLALRASAKIDTIDGIYAIAADSNNDSKITAMDARTILRKAAGLE